MTETNTIPRFRIGAPVVLARRAVEQVALECRLAADAVADMPALVAGNSGDPGAVAVRIGNLPIMDVPVSMLAEAR